MATNVRAEDLNYDRYENEKYDQDILRVIPGYEKLHKKIENIFSNYNQDNHVEKIAELGVGTGISSERILRLAPKATLTAIDFSEVMLSGAKNRLEKYNVKFILGDYAIVEYGNEFDIVLSVIGIHHQNHEGKRKLFEKIYRSLKSRGIFIFGDLVTYKDEEKKRQSSSVKMPREEQTAMSTSFRIADMISATFATSAGPSPRPLVTIEK